MLASMGIPTVILVAALALVSIELGGRAIRWLDRRTSGAASVVVVAVMVAILVLSMFAPHRDAGDYPHLDETGIDVYLDD